MRRRRVRPRVEQGVHTDSPLPTFQSAESSGNWTTLHGDVLAAWRVLGPLALRATVGVEAPLARPTFVVTIPQASSQVALHQPNAVGGAATLGVEAHFP